MASGDDIEAGRITAAEATTNLIAQIPTGDNPPPFDGEFILRVVPQTAGETKPHQTLDAILGKGANGAVPSPGGAGVTGIGGPNQGTGVIGRGGGDDQGQGGIGVIGKGGGAQGPTFGPVNPGVGVFGQGGLQDDFTNVTGQPHAAGVMGVAGNASLPSFEATGSVGVYGQGASADRKTVTVNGNPGVSGPDKPGPGIFGRGALQSLDGAVSGNPSAGVIGLAGDAAFPAFDEASNAGVYGKGASGVIGVAGADIGRNIANPGFGTGVLGITNEKSAAGMTAISLNDPAFPTLIAINGAVAPEQGVLAVYVLGNAHVEGNAIATGFKSAAVPHLDGSHRLLYALESPECWFEDFGDGQLVDGRADVRLDADFATLVVTNGYHVFVTPYGECNGLFVSDRGVTGFRVCEQQGGTCNVSFAYRVVARRKDIIADRLARVTLPKIPIVGSGVHS